MAGNITKIKDGYYRLRYKDYSKYVSAKSNREAKRLLAKLVTEVDSGNFYKPSKLTFKQFAKKWIEVHAEAKLTPKTVFRYKEMLESRIYNAFGDKKLSRIRPLDLVSFYNSLRKNHKYMTMSKSGIWGERESGPLSERTILHHHRLISSIFGKAFEWEVLRGASPIKRGDAPKAEEKEAAHYDMKQVQALLAALDKTGPVELKYKVATILAFASGARLGEIMGLEWQDIDADNKTMAIRRSSQYLPGRGVFTTKTKTKKSNRRIPINDSLLGLLEEYKKDQLEKGFVCQDNNRLFVTWEGKPMHPFSVSSWFSKFLRKNKLPKLNFHGLRHTSATFLVQGGIDVKTVAGRLGHSTSVTTQDIYVHTNEGSDRQAANLMELLFNNKNKSV